jgi:hypothetical protein
MWLRKRGDEECCYGPRGDEECCYGPRGEDSFFPQLFSHHVALCYMSRTEQIKKTFARSVAIKYVGLVI